MEPFDPEESNASVEGADYGPTPVRSYSTKCDHYWESRGIQPTGEQLVKCRYCPLGMELPADTVVIDGKVVWF